MITFSDNTVRSNAILEEYRGGGGGGIYLSSQGTATFSGNTICDNGAGFGGGVYVDLGGTVTLSGNTIWQNSAFYGGGGVYVPYSGTVTIRENVILYNGTQHDGAGGIDVGLQGHPTISRNDIVGNYPAQLWNRNPKGSPNLDARDNWWGSINERNIRGEVDWQPYLIAPVFSNHLPFPPAIPYPPSNNGARGVVRDPTLGWLASTDLDPGDTVSYDVYLGTAADPPLVSVGQSSADYSPGLLERYTTYYWRVVARDSQGAETPGSRWSFTTGGGPGPALDPIGDKTIGEGQTLSFTLSGRDSDGAPLAFSASNLPPGASFDPTNRHFSWTPARGQAGTYPGVRFSASNGTYTDSKEITITVMNVVVHSVSGTVRDSRKLLVPEVRVEARGADGTLADAGITDSQGYYQIVLAAGQYILTPNKETHLFSPASRKVTVKAKDLGKVNFTIKVLTLSGTVKAKTGKPLARVDVLLKQDGRTVDTTVTNVKGKYNFTFYNTGTYMVVPSWEESRFTPESMEVTLTKGNRSGINFKEMP